MRRYYYNARDVAAYFKYFSVPSYLEVSYMQFVFNLGRRILAEPLTRDFEQFKREIYRELYFLWSNGFDSETSDISCMVSDGQMSLICDQECINLESYMKLICLHLIYSANLPYINLNFAGLMYTLGIDCDVELYEADVAKIADALGLKITDCFGNDFDLSLGIPDELLRVSLDPEFRESLSGSNFKETLRLEQLEMIKELKNKSMKIFGQFPQLKKSSSKKNNGNASGKNETSRSQPKGAPSKNKKR